MQTNRYCLKKVGFHISGHLAISTLKYKVVHEWTKRRISIAIIMAIEQFTHSLNHSFGSITHLAQLFIWLNYSLGSTTHFSQVPIWLNHTFDSITHFWNDHMLNHSLAHLLICVLTHLNTYSLNCSLTQLLIHLLNRLVAYPWYFSWQHFLLVFSKSCLCGKPNCTV